MAPSSKTVVFDFLRNEARLPGGLVVAVEEAGRCGELRVGGAAGPVLQPLRFGERTRIVLRAASSPQPVDSVCSGVLRAATSTVGELDRIVQEVLALVLAGAEEDGPPFDEAALLVARAARWSPDQIAQSEAAEVDRLAGLVDNGLSYDGWHRIVLTDDRAVTLDALRKVMAERLLDRARPAPEARDAPAASAGPAAAALDSSMGEGVAESIPAGTTQDLKPDPAIPSGASGGKESPSPASLERSGLSSAIPEIDKSVSRALQRKIMEGDLASRPIRKLPAAPVSRKAPVRANRSAHAGIDRSIDPASSEPGSSVPAPAAPSEAEKTRETISSNLSGQQDLMSAVGAGRSVESTRLAGPAPAEGFRPASLSRTSGDGFESEERKGGGKDIIQSKRSGRTPAAADRPGFPSWSLDENEAWPSSQDSRFNGTDRMAGRESPRPLNGTAARVTLTEWAAGEAAFRLAEALAERLDDEADLRGIER